MGHLHLLPVASFAAHPPGFVSRQRTPVEGATLDALDAEVAAVGGYIQGKTLVSRNMRRGRMTPRREHVSWYVIPADASALDA